MTKLHESNKPLVKAMFTEKLEKAGKFLYL